MHLVCAWLIRGDILPLPTFQFVTYSWDSKLKSSTTIYSSLNHPIFSDKAQDPIYNLGIYAYKVHNSLPYTWLVMPTESERVLREKSESMRWISEWGFELLILYLTKTNSFIMCNWNTLTLGKPLTLYKLLIYI